MFPSAQLATKLVRVLKVQALIDAIRTCVDRCTLLFPLEEELLVELPKSSSGLAWDIAFDDGGTVALHGAEVILWTGCLNGRQD